MTNEELKAEIDAMLRAERSRLGQVWRQRGLAILIEEVADELVKLRRHIAEHRCTLPSSDPRGAQFREMAAIREGYEISLEDAAARAERAEAFIADKGLREEFDRWEGWLPS